MSVKQNSINANATTPLPTIEGGSGVSSPTAHGILVAEGASAFTPIVLTAGQVLIGTTGSDPAAATLSNGSNIAITSSSGSISVATSATPNFSSVEVNNGTNNITIQPPSSGLTNTTYTLPTAAPGTSGEVLSSNTSGVMSWTANTAGNLVLLSTNTVTTQSTFAITGLTNSYTYYIVEISNVQMSAAASSVLMRMSINNGSTYDAGPNYYYSSWTWDNVPGSGAGGGNAQGDINLNTGGTLANGTGQIGQFTVKLWNIDNGTAANAYRVYCNIVSNYDNGSQPQSSLVNGFYNAGSSNQVQAFEVFPSSGTFSAIVKVYGIS